MECRPDSAGIGRRVISDAVLGWGVGEGDPAWDVLGDVLLVASELLGNAIHVCARQIVLSVEAHHDRLRVEVRDDSPLPATPKTPDIATLSGRGLAIVEALSQRWGQTDFDGVTKDVWAEVAFLPGSVLATLAVAEATA